MTKTWTAMTNSAKNTSEPRSLSAGAVPKPRAGSIPLVRMVMGTCFRGYRTEGGWTLRDVADRARVSPGYLSEIERGRKEVSSELIESVCEALGVSVSTLLIDTGQRLAACEAIQAAALQGESGIPPHTPSRLQFV